MIKIFITLLFFGLCSSLIAQKVDTVKVLTDKQQIILGEKLIGSGTKVTDVVNVLGTPSRIEKIAGIDRHFIYDGLGLAFDGGKRGIVEAITFNFNWDQDKKVAQETYKGILLVDNFSINETTKTNDINTNTKIKDVVCIMPTMCMTKPAPGKMVLLLGYTKEAKITQITFGFNNNN